MTIKTTYLLLFGILLSFCSIAQDYPTDYLSASFHADRRAAVKKQLSDKGVGIFFAGQTRQRSNDTDFPYAQNKNFYYLTGLDEPNAVLLLFKQPVSLLGKTGTEFIFVQNRDPFKELWTGKILGIDGFRAQSKMENIFINEEFKASTLPMANIDSVFSLFRTEGIFNKYKVKEDALSHMAGTVDSLVNAFKKPLAMRSTMAIMRNLRGIKTAEEITLIKKAVTMSTLGHNDVMRAIRPGMKEFQAQAIMEYHFKNNGSEFPGYGSINGSAENACVLHYVTNLKTIKNGDLLLSDCAAEYHGYSADVTRTVPANGKFSEAQKTLYEIVLAAQDTGIAACQAGAPMANVDAAARAVVNAGLIKLGIAKNDMEARTYFPHGTSHHLGLDVHDLGPRILQPGVVITVEPGIYIPAGSKCDKKWWNIGIRIEDDILITEKGPDNLSAGSPRKVADIEKMAKQKSMIEN